MATRKSLTVRKTQKAAAEDSQNSASGNDTSCGNNSSGARRKTKSTGIVVKSRYMQTEKKTSVAKNNMQNESILGPPRPASPKASGAYKPRVGTPPRRTLTGLSGQPDQNSSPVMPSILETSAFGGNVLQSTVLDGHCFRPDFDLSVIKENTAPPSAVDPKAQKRNLELETFLLAFLTAKIEHNTHKLKDEAEKNLLIMMEEEEKLRLKVMGKKRQYHLLEKHKQLNDLLDLQVTALTPAAATAKQFTEEYKTFATAVDTTRHELPVKNLHIEEDRGKFLDKAVVCLNQSRRALEQYVTDTSTGSESITECLKEMKNAAHEIDQQLLSASSELLELSSLVSRETVLAQQSSEEDTIGLATAQALFLD
ncbi:hypothetical protein MHYP_G00075070 [Metynnis hypsauchen]